MKLRIAAPIHCLPHAAAALLAAAAILPAPLFAATSPVGIPGDRAGSASPHNGLVKLAQAAPAASAADQAAAKTEISPLKYMPPGSTLYMEVNLDAGKQFMDSMKDTRWGRDFNRALTTGKNPADSKKMQMFVGMLQGFGHHIGVSMTFPQGPAAPIEQKTPAVGNAAKGGPAANPFPFGIPVIVAAVPVLDPTAVKTEVRLALAAIGSGSAMQWKDEPEGDNVVHTASLPKGAPPGISPSYALTSDAIIIGSTSAAVHGALRQALAGGPDLSSSADFQNVAGRLDRTQIAWSYINEPQYIAATAGAMPGAPPGPGAPDFNPLKLPGVKSMIGAVRGAGFSVALHPDRIEMQSITTMDQDSDLGKTFAAFKGSALKAPSLVFGHPVVFVDFADMPHWAGVYSQFIKPMIGAITSLAGNDPGAASVTPMIGMATQLLDDLVNGSGNELAFAAGPLPASMKPAQPGTGIPTLPPLILMIQKSDNPRLAHGIQQLTEAISNATGMKWYTKTLNQTDLMILGPANSPIRPAYAPIGDFHVLALDLGALKTPLYLSTATPAAGAPGRSLADNPDFQKITAMLGGQFTALVYVDVHSIARLGFEAARSAASKKSKPAGGSSAAQEAIVEDIVSGIGQLASANYPDPSGIGARMVLTFNPNAVPEGHGGVGH